MKNAFRIGIIILTIAILTSCSANGKLLKGHDFDAQFKAAMKCYNEKNYSGAIQLYENLIMHYHGRENAEDISWYYGMSLMQIKDYYSAGYQFKNFNKRFPYSERAEESLFLAAKCKYLQSPEYYLDQKLTKEAIQEFESYVDRYPTSIHIPEINTKKVTNANSMFKGCSRLEEIDASNFNTEKITDMGEMFSGCSSLVELDINGFDTSNVTNMENMFTLCYSLEGLDVSGFDTSKVTNMYGMFSGCTGLRKLDVSGFDTSNVTNMAFMFRGCAKVSSLGFSSFDTSKVTNMYGMFNGAGVTSLDLSGFDTSRVTSMTGMFYDAVRLRELNVSGWDTSKVQEGSYLFHGCASLIGLDLSGWNTAAMQDHEQMYDGCSSLQSVKVDSAYQIKDEGMFPDVTATTGSWWSLDKQEWLSKADIVSGRSGVADTYTIYADTDHGIGIADAKVTLGESSYTWTGAEVKPTVTVELDGMTLRHGIDYDVSYQDNVQVGEAQLTVTGKGAFKGTKTVPFTIAYNSIFIDVTEKTAHIEDVIWMADNDIAEGWLRTDGKREFRPYTGVARADMAAFLHRMDGLE